MKLYQIGDGWLSVKMSSTQAEQWNSSTLPLADLRKLKAAHKGSLSFQTLGELLDNEDISRDDLGDRAIATRRAADPYRTTYHRDGTVTVWNTYRQCWMRVEPDQISGQILATLSDAERSRILRHKAR